MARGKEKEGEGKGGREGGAEDEGETQKWMKVSLQKWSQRFSLQLHTHFGAEARSNIFAYCMAQFWEQTGQFLHHYTALHTTTHHYTALYTTVQHYILPYSTLLYNTPGHSTIHYTQHNYTQRYKTHLCTFWEKNSGGRFASISGFMALVTETLPAAWWKDSGKCAKSSNCH